MYVRFSEELDPGAPSTIQAEFEVGGSVIPASVSLTQAKEVALIQQTPFPLPSRVQVRLRGQVKDVAGNVLALDGETWTFFVPAFQQIAGLPYQLCGMEQRGREIWLSDCYGLAVLAPDGGTGPRIGPAGYLDFFFVQSPPGETFVFAETGFPGTSRSTQLFRLDAGAPTLDPVFPPLTVDSDALSWFAATDAAHPVAALQTRPRDAGVGQVQLFQWSGTEWSGLTAPIPSRASSLVQAEGGIYAYLEPAANGVSVGTARVQSDGGWAPIGAPFPVIALGIDANGALVRSAPWFTNYRLERWTGSEWVAIGEDTLPDPAIRFAFDSHNIPVVVTLGNGSFAVRRWTAAGWRVIGEPFSSIYGFQFNIFISFDPDDLAVVAWSDESTTIPAVSFVARETRE